MKHHDYDKHSSEYAQLGIEGTSYLAFRDIPELLQKYVKKKKSTRLWMRSGSFNKILEIVRL